MGLYDQLEKKYYEWLDSLEDKGIHVYGVVDVLEKNNIPSFPVVVLVSLLAILLIGYLASQVLFASQSTLVVNVVDGDQQAVVGETVVVRLGDETLESLTNSAGQAVFSVSRNVSAEISLREKPSFSSGSEIVTIDQENEEVTIYVQRDTISFATNWNIVDSSTKRIITKSIMVTLSCTTGSFTQDVSFTNGQASVSGIPSDCGSLSVSSTQGTVLNSPLDPTLENMVLEFSEKALGQGRLLVTTVGSDGVGVSGLTVTVSATDSTNTVQIAVTAQNGVASFSTLPNGSYRVHVSDDAGRFVPYTTTSPVQVSDQNESAITVELVGSESIPLTVLVLSSDGKPVNHAQVELRKDDQLQGIPTFTNELGQAVLNTSKSITYEIRVDHPNYFIASMGNVKPGPTPLTVTLQSADGEQSTLVVVRVEDETTNPIAGAIVSLVDSTGNVAGSEQSTGSEGEARFDRLVPGNYQLVASVPGVGSDTQSVVVKSRQVASVKSVIVVGSGVINVQTKSDESPANGLVDVLDATDGLILQQNIPLNSSGEGSVTVRANQKVVLRVRTSNLAPSLMGPFQVAKDSQLTAEVPLAPFVLTNPQVSLFSIKSGNEVVDLASRQLSSNQTYTLEYLVSMPQNSVFDQVTVHIRSDSLEGPLDHVIVEEDSAHFLGSTVDSLSRTVKGKSFSPPNGTAIDLAKVSEPPFKWLNFVWKNPEPGNMVVRIPYVVTSAASTGSVLELLSRFEGKTKKEIQRVPFDDALGTQMDSVEKQGLYAQVSTNQFRVGVSNTCTQMICSNFKATDLTDQVAIVLSDDVQSDTGHSFKLEGSLITQPTFNAAPTSARILVSDSGLTFSESSLVLQNGRTVSWTSNQQNGVELGVLSPNSTLQFSTLIKTVNEGTSTFKLQFMQGSSMVWEKTIRFNVKQGVPLEVDVLPKSMIAGANNQVLVLVKDSEGKAVSKAFVSAVVDGVQVSQSAFTDSMGKAEFALNELSAGSKVVIRVEKPGFSLFEQLFTTSNQVVIVEPDPLSVHFTVDSDPVKVVALTLRNASSFPIQVTQVKLPLFQGYLLGRVTDSSLPVKIEPDGNAVVNVEFRLLPKGMTIVNPVVLTQNATITSMNTVSRTRYVQSYLVEGSVGLNGFTDGSECLSVSPGSWKIVSSGEMVQLAGEITNNCTVDQESISLSQLQAKLDWKNTNPIGSFSILSRGTDGQGNVGISNTFQNFSGTVPKNGKVPFELTFNPTSVPTAQSEAVIEIVGINRTEGDPQLISQKISVDVSVNQLFACVKVVSAGKIEVTTNPVQLGLGLYSNNNQPSATPSYVVPEGAANFPDTSFRGGLVDPYQDNYTSPVNSSFTSALASQATKAPNTTNQVSISNTCLVPVDISLIVPDSLSVNRVTFTIAPKGNESFTISSGYKTGRTEIDVLARAAGSLNPTPAKIASVPVTVKTSNAASLGANCISLKTRVFSFTNLPGAAPAPGQVVNNCYAQGVRLLEGGNAIQLFDNGLANYPQNYNTQPYYQNYLQQPQMAQSGSFVQTPSEFQVQRPAGYSGSSSGYSNGFIQTPSEFQSNPNYYGTSGYTPQAISPVANPNAPTVGLGTGVIVLNKSLQGNAEVVTFGIQRNSGYRDSPPVSVPVSGFQQQGPVGFFPGGSGQTQVSNPGTISVNFTDAYGNPQSKSFPVLLTDTILPSATIRQYEEAGNPYLEDLQDCVASNGIRLTLDDDWFADHCDDSRAQDNCNVGTMVLEDVLIVDRDHCSSTDSIESIRPTQLNGDQGVRITLEKSGRQEIEMKVDRTSLATGTVTIKQDLRIEIARPQFGKSQRVNLPVEFMVVRGTGPSPSVTSPEAKNLAPYCAEDSSKWITPRITYNWNVTDWGFTETGAVKKNTCTQISGSFPESNPNTYYCDGTQLALELHDKLERSTVLIEAAKKAGESALVDADLPASRDSYYSLPHVYRFLKAQVVLEDNSKKKAYFVKENFEPISRKLTSDEKKDLETAFSLTAGDIADLDKTDADSLLRVLKSLSVKFGKVMNTNPTSAVKLVQEDGWLYWDDAEKYILLQGLVTGIRIISKQDGSEIKEISEFNKLSSDERKNYYLLQPITKAKEFIDRQVNQCLKDGKTLVSAAKEDIKEDCLGTPSGDSQLVLLMILKQYNEFKLVIGIRNNDTVNDATLTQVLKEGMARPGQVNITDKEYFRDIQFNSFLMEDQLSEDFFNDFKDAYQLTGKPILKAKTKDRELPIKISEPGTYQTLLNYNWKNDLFTLELTKKDSSPNFKDNPFYHWSFDGALGLAKNISGSTKNSDGTREGYGVLLSQVSLLDQVKVFEDLELSSFNGVNNGGKQPYKLLSWDTFVDIESFSSEEQKGRVMQIKKQDNTYNVRFVPSNQIILEATINDRGSVTRSGMDYSILENGRTPLANEVIWWTKGADLVRASTYRSASRGLCGQTTNSDQRSIEWNGTMNGVAYTPLALTATTDYSFAVSCATQDIDLKAKSRLGRISSESVRALGTTIRSIDLTSDAKEVSLMDYIHIENYCLTANQNNSEFTLAWNYND